VTISTHSLATAARSSLGGAPRSPCCSGKITWTPWTTWCTSTAPGNAARLAYRLEETNTAARQGVVGVSDVAASAIYALDMMFHVACPQPPHLPGVNADCTVGGVGMNLQNAARNGNTNPSQGNAFYNVIYFDSSPTMGPPVPAPEYYGALMFAHFAQGTTACDLSPSPARTRPASPHGGSRQAANERRLFLINKSTSSLTTSVANVAPGSLMSRMTPFDPTGAGLVLDAASLKIDGRQVRADGTWPGFAPTTVSPAGGVMNVTLGPGEAVVIRSGIPTDVSSRIRIKPGCSAPAIRGRSTSRSRMSAAPRSTDRSTSSPTGSRLASRSPIANGIVANVPPAGVPYVTVLGANQTLGAGASTLTQLRWSTSGADDRVFAARALRAGSAVDKNQRTRGSAVDNQIQRLALPSSWKGLSGWRASRFSFERLGPLGLRLSRWSWCGLLCGASRYYRYVASAKPDVRTYDRRS
jgi:hypothetical protein